MKRTTRPLSRVAKYHTPQAIKERQQARRKRTRRQSVAFLLALSLILPVLFTGVTYAERLLSPYPAYYSDTTKVIYMKEKSRLLPRSVATPVWFYNPDEDE